MIVVLSFVAGLALTYGVDVALGGSKDHFGNFLCSTVLAASIWAAQ